MVESWPCTRIASIRFLLMETNMFKATKRGEIREPGGVSPGVIARTGEPILRQAWNGGDITSAAA